jgi:type II secretory ATPase GspE/PulE/Tfp pilus assembly ATPase PilB-like protein
MNILKGKPDPIEEKQNSVASSKKIAPNASTPSIQQHSHQGNKGQSRPVQNKPVSQGQNKQNSQAGQRPRSHSGSTASVPVRVEARHGRAVVATDEEVKELLSLSGELVTAPNGPYPLTPALRQYVALISPDGEVAKNILAIAKGYHVHPETSSAKSSLRQSGQSWVKETLVDMDVVRQIYAHHEQKFGKFYTQSSTRGGNSPSAETAIRQKEFLGLIQRAADMKASDIHLIIGKNIATIRFRIDGQVSKTPEMQDLPIIVANELLMAAFAMADASDPTYNPLEYQGARVTDTSLKGLRFPEGVQAVRLQFNPLPAGGRYMVARLLYSQKIGSDSDVDQLGYAPIQVKQSQSMRKKPYGINIISGPTGSGKSTTLQRGLTALMREKVGINVVTIEDPPEYVIEGAAQLPVTNAKTAEERSEKFRQAITASLRSDPDVIMIGEIRDQASSQLAFEAAMTGHGVWASLHANDAASILDRLRDQHVEMYKLCDASLVTGLIGQRLLRKSIDKYTVDFNEGVNLGFISKDEEAFMRTHASAWINQVRFAGTHLFDENPNNAFSGRRVVAEVIEPDQTFLDLVKNEQKSEAVDYWKNKLGGITMLEHAFVLVCMGQLDIREMDNNIGSVLRIQHDRIPLIIKLVSENNT